ncbi:hypothetical protein BZA05DRAFT_119831 [Tricharina praecox]|uniref:uncharacterized protein n=1 Tax=Tricharina praecox TaxID=43433 RepID=UPI00221E7E90|nr:uncharacterized protein BZA05DRAFT_119831 [Tricharina praecox]KAI5848094.1 hypothetical protein BZA05DRAFT_119831 [Tricharina praecox]
MAVAFFSGGFFFSSTVLHRRRFLSPFGLGRLLEAACTLQLYTVSIVAISRAGGIFAGVGVDGGRRDGSDGLLGFQPLITDARIPITRLTPFLPHPPSCFLKPPPSAVFPLGTLHQNIQQPNPKSSAIVTKRPPNESPPLSKSKAPGRINETHAI